MNEKALDYFTGKITDGQTIILFQVRPEFAGTKPHPTAATVMYFKKKGGSAIKKMSRADARQVYRMHVKAFGFKPTTADVI